MSTKGMKNVESLSVDDLEDNTIKDLSDIPGPRPSLPFIGTGWQYFRFIGRYSLSQLHQANQHKFETYGPIVKEEYQWGKPIIHIFDPKDIETVLRNQGKCPIRPPNEFVSHYRTSNSDKYPNVGLANMVGDQWLRYRQLLAPTLMSLKVIQNHVTTQNAICTEFVDYLWQTRDQTNDTIDITDATYRLALESICMLCLDSRIHCFSTDDPKDGLITDGQTLINATKSLFESYNELYYGMPLWKIFYTKAYRKLDESESCIYQIVTKYVQKGFDEHHSDDGDHHSQSVLKTLVNSEGLSENDIKITIIDFIVGGIFTVSNTLSFLFYHLAANREVQQKLYKEVSQVMADSDQLTPDMLANMPYLKACVKECFRLNSPVPGIMRVLTEPIVLSNYHIPAQTIIFSHLMVASRLRQYYNDPLNYFPDRWLTPNESHPFAVLPFGYGNRMCVGKRFSELELYLATAHLIRKYEISTTQPKLDLKFCFIIIPEHNIEIKLKPRQRQCE